MNEEEVLLIRSFVVRNKRQRLLDQLSNPKRRRFAVSSLAHFRDLDQCYVVHPPPERTESTLHRT